MTPLHDPNDPTETLTVDLAAIRQDPTWPVDADLVSSFRDSIRRGEPPLLELSLNRMLLSDGASGLDVIDGSHRLEALRLEGVTTHSAKVRVYSPHDAFYARIATSIGKPNDLFRQRAERALREGFVQDVATYLDGATVYQRGVAEDGTPRPTPRREPLPADPLLALGTILWVHFAVKPEVTEDWERYVLTWLEDIAKRLGKTPAWLRDEVLQITALLGEDLPGKPTAERARLLLAIPDDGVMRLALARLKAEPKLATTDLRFALDMLGCGPDVGRHSWLKPRSLPEMRSLLAHATLAQLARDYTDALARAEAASRAIRLPAPVHPHPPAPTAPTAPTASTAPTLNLPPPAMGASGLRTLPTSPGVPPPEAPAPSEPPPGVQPPSAASAAADAADVTRSADRRAVDEPISPPDSTPVFGVVSARFGRTVSHVGNATHDTTTQATPPTTTTGNPIMSPDNSPDDAFLTTHRLIDALIEAWHAFDQRGGDWSRPDVRRDLTRLRTVIDTYLTRGADPPPRAPTS
jgi:hypothetical protein